MDRDMKELEQIKTSFSIKDLENLSGIKAHTIRIWEKRYNLLAPERTDTNIRTYTIESLRKLLNVTLLYNNGHKISKIAQYTEPDILEYSRTLVSDMVSKNQFINDMKIAMLNFDQLHFEAAYKNLERLLPFQSIFNEYFIPFLGELGLLWQTDTINPAHEHFISHLIKRKVLINIEKLNIVDQQPTSKTTFILFLPDNEIHQLGLTYLNYELLSRGCKTIYLGESVPIDNLRDFPSYYDNIVFISYFTVKPDTEKIAEYLQQFSEDMLVGKQARLWVLGFKARSLDTNTLPEKVTVFKSIAKMIENVKDL